MPLKAAGRFLMIVLISAVLAPLIGGLAFFAVRAAIDADDIKGLFVIVMLGTYAVGRPIALLAGLLVALIDLWRTLNLPVVLGAVIIANVAILVMQPVIGFGWGGFFINLATSVFAGIVWWFLFRQRLSGR